MTAGQGVPAKYYDGMSAKAHSVTIHISDNTLRIDGEGVSVDWGLQDVSLLLNSSIEIRIGHKDYPDAILVVQPENADWLRVEAPALFDRAPAIRRMAVFVGSLVVVAAAIASILFIGVPAASGPLAQATPRDFEEQMGENLVAQYSTFMKRCSGSGAAEEAIEPLLVEMGEVADAGFPIRFRFIRMGMPNAFALPGGQVMVTSGLLEDLSDDPEAFVAVVAHEVGHVKARDGLQAFYRNIGLSFLLEAVTGGSGIAQQAILLGGQLTQLKHTRDQEARADEIATDIMIDMELDPAALGRAFEAMLGLNQAEDADADEDASEDSEEGGIKIPAWLSSHPDTMERIEYARSRARPTDRVLFTDQEWETIRTACSESSDVAEPGLDGEVAEEAIADGF